MIPPNSGGLQDYSLKGQPIKEEGTPFAFSQEAVVNGKTIKITLTFKHDINPTQAQKAMKDNLEKVVELTKAFSLGDADAVSGETTRKLIVHKDAELTRYFTKPGLAELHTFKYNPEQVKDIITNSREAITRANVEGFVGQHPFQADNNEPGNQVEYEPVNSFPPSVPSQTKLSATASSDKGKVIEDTFVINRKLVATEKAERIETVSMLTNGLLTKIKGLEAKIDYLESLPNRSPIQEQSFLKARNEHEKTCIDLAQYNEKTNGATHASMNAPRFAFANMGRETAKKELLPVLSNLRMQTVKNADGEVVSAVTRSAAITDFRNGEVSLQELKDFHNFISKNELPPATELMKKLYLNDDQSMADVALLIKLKALVGYGADALVKTDQNTDALKNFLENMQSAGSIEEHFNKLSAVEKDYLQLLSIDETKLDGIINERTSFLKQLALQDLHVHLHTTPFKGNGPILYARTALVDLNKGANNESGCIIHERTQGLDMKAVFDDLKNATLIFEDVAAAFIDEDGKIHMPLNCSADGAKEATLRPVFFNICVQGSKGHMLNIGMQKAINDETLDGLREHFGDKPEFQALEAALTEMEKSEKYDPNEAVLLVSQFIQKNGGYSGVNCFGGKDRTGYALALISHAKIAELAKKDVSSPEMKKIGHQLLSSKAIAAKVAEDNADHTTLKLRRYDLKLFDVESTKGKMVRASHIVGAAYLTAKPMFKKMFGTSPLSVSSTPGQLYKDDVNISTSSKTHEVFDNFRRWFTKKDDLSAIDVNIEATTGIEQRREQQRRVEVGDSFENPEEI
ncbi:MAG TPA: hypothetical protein VGP47_00410 [Parachlamydiaceae bacterium]|nr:hypothetical protein [Parachlamydiaceae bacterium]